MILARVKSPPRSARMGACEHGALPAASAKIVEGWNLLRKRAEGHLFPHKERRTGSTGYPGQKSSSDSGQDGLFQPSLTLAPGSFKSAFGDDWTVIANGSDRERFHTVASRTAEKP